MRVSPSAETCSSSMDWRPDLGQHGGMSNKLEAKDGKDDA